MRTPTAAGPGDLALDNADGRTGDAELVVLVGGPLHGRWYFATDWQEHLRAADRAERDMPGRPPRDCQRYRPTDRTMPHPDPRRWPPGHVWVPIESESTVDDKPGQDESAVPGRRVLVTGSRTWPWPAVICRALEAERARVPEGGVLTVVHGACRSGADAAAAAWCAQAAEQPGARVVEEPHPAVWRGSDETVDRRAGMVRNAVMVELGADLVLGFLLDGSPGTADCLSRTAAARIPALIHRAHTTSGR